MHFNYKIWRNGFLGQLLELAGLLIFVFMIRTFGFGLYQVPSGSMETTMLVGERFFADKFSYWLRSPRRGDIIACNAPTFDYSPNVYKRFFQKFIWGPENWTKRVIGIPGEHVQGVIKDGKPVIYVNGKEIDEPHINQYPLVRVGRVDESYNGLFCSQNAFAISQNVVWKSFDPEIKFDEQIFYRINPDFIIRDCQDNPFIEWPETPKKSYQKLVGVDEDYWDGSDQFSIKLKADQYWVMGDNRLASSDSRVFGPITGSSIHGRIVFRIWSVDSDESWWILDVIKHPIDFWSRVRWYRFFDFMK